MRPIVLLSCAVLVLALCCNALLAEEKRQPMPKTTTGELTKIEGSTLTVTRRGDSGEKSDKFTLDAKTKILIETDQDETVKVKREGGEKTITRPKAAEGKAADLKTGGRVSVIHGDDGKATQVTLHRPAKPRKKEGER